jgi:hypothetical protein
MKTLVNRSLRAATILLALSFFACIPTLAQDTSSLGPEPTYSPPAFSWGIKAGLIANEFTGESTDISESGTSLTGGAFLAYRLSNILALQPEILVTHRSGRVDHSRIFTGSQYARYSFGFVEVPVHLKAYLPVQQGARPYLIAGPYASLRFSEHAEDPNEALDKVDLNDTFRRWDYGLRAGLGFERFTGRSTLSLDGMYSWGLANLFSDSDLPDFKTHGFTFTLGIGL